jgi:hypothetical protein
VDLEQPATTPSRASKIMIAFLIDVPPAEFSQQWARQRDARRGLVAPRGLSRRGRARARVVGGGDVANVEGEVVMVKDDLCGR